MLCLFLSCVTHTVPDTASQILAKHRDSVFDPTGLIQDYTDWLWGSNGVGKIQVIFVSLFGQ